MEMKCDICRRRKAVQVVILRGKDKMTGEEFVDRKLVCKRAAAFVSKIVDADTVEMKVLRRVHL